MHPEEVDDWQLIIPGSEKRNGGIREGGIKVGKSDFMRFHFALPFVPGSKLPLFFHIIGDGHQPNSRGLCTHYKDSLLKVG